MDFQNLYNQNLNSYDNNNNKKDSEGNLSLILEDYGSNSNMGEGNSLFFY